MASTAPELVWKYVGQPARRHKPGPGACEACGDVTLNVWARVGPKLSWLSLYRCWLHGPGQDGRECDGAPGG